MVRLIRSAATPTRRLARLLYKQQLAPLPHSPLPSRAARRPIDHDDGSNNYYDGNNLLLWGWVRSLRGGPQPMRARNQGCQLPSHTLPSLPCSGAKNYLGFNKHMQTNLYLYPDALEPTVGGGGRLRTGFSPYCYDSQGATAIDAARRDSSVNCTCVAMSAGAIYSLGSCDAAHIDNGLVPLLTNNTYYLDSGEYSFPCGSARWDLPTAQQHGVDVGTVQRPSPATGDLLALARAFVHAQMMRP